jgi:hypothetical protein
MPHESGLTCIHCTDGLCEDCQESYDIDPDANSAIREVRPLTPRRWCNGSTTPSRRKTGSDSHDDAC